MPEKASEEVKTVINEQPNVQASPISENKPTELPKKHPGKKEIVLVLKSGDTDLRRGPKALNELIKRTGNNPQDGNMYAFSNVKNTIKIIQQKDDGTEMLVKKTNAPINNWPEYKEKGLPGYMVVLTGKEKNDFLGKLGCPKTL
ncbi:MAG: IS66 family insertion sequence element accessory protein TnpB [Bacteroidales bacterium]|jgi:hypothetical protein|nr:IS66 family insertion sequence element accessory protein TnpB [Bacteroidales bacterium]